MNGSGLRLLVPIGRQDEVEDRTGLPIAEEGCTIAPQGVPYVRGDTNADGKLDASEIKKSASFHQHPGWTDTNGDGAVDVTDLTAVILDWGTDGSANNGDTNGDGNPNDASIGVLAVHKCKQ